MFRGAAAVVAMLAAWLFVRQRRRRRWELEELEKGRAGTLATGWRAGFEVVLPLLLPWALDEDVC